MELNHLLAFELGISTIRQLPWQTDQRRALSECAAILEDIDGETVNRQLLEVATRQQRHQIDRSFVRPSHNKWYLGGEPASVMVWAHEYVDELPPDQLGSFAASTHNHRYGFASRIINGSITSTTFRSTLSGDGGLIPCSHLARGAGETYVMTSDEVHRIDRVAPSTITLVIQGLPVAETSSVYNRESRAFLQVDGNKDRRVSEADRQSAHNRYRKKLQGLAT